MLAPPLIIKGGHGPSAPPPLRPPLPYPEDEVAFFLKKPARVSCPLERVILLSVSQSLNSRNCQISMNIPTSDSMFPVGERVKTKWALGSRPATASGVSPFDLGPPANAVKVSGVGVGGVGPQPGPAGRRRRLRRRVVAS